MSKNIGRDTLYPIPQNTPNFFSLPVSVLRIHNQPCITLYHIHSYPYNGPILPADKKTRSPEFHINNLFFSEPSLHGLVRLRISRPNISQAWSAYNLYSGTAAVTVKPPLRQFICTSIKANVSKQTAILTPTALFRCYQIFHSLPPLK